MRVIMPGSAGPQHAILSQDLLLRRLSALPGYENLFTNISGLLLFVRALAELV